jgi:ribosome-associated toxin RatA of RatAB toxin-antitoxin module
MPQVYSATHVDAPPEEIFDFLADYHNIPRLQPHFDKVRLVSEKERGLGAVVELKGRFHGVPMTGHNKIVAFQRPFRLVSISDGTVLSRNTWEVRPLALPDPACEVSLSIEYKFSGGITRLLAGVASPLVHGEIPEMTEEALRRLHSIFAR